MTWKRGELVKHPAVYTLRHGNVILTVTADNIIVRTTGVFLNAHNLPDPEVPLDVPLHMNRDRDLRDWPAWNYRVWLDGVGFTIQSERVLSH